MDFTRLEYLILNQVSDRAAFDKVPVLGSGKLDYVGVTNLVREHLAACTAVAETAVAV